MNSIIALLPVLALVLAAAVATLAFAAGDRRRRRAAGLAGPRPAPSIGEALRIAELREGRVLVIFLGEDEASAEASRALAEDPAVLELLARRDLPHALVRYGHDDVELAAHLFEKYAGRALREGAGPVALLLDPQGRCLAEARGDERGPVAAWLPAWAGGP